MTSEVSKVLRLPRKMQRIVWKRRKSSALATQNGFWHVLKHVGMSRSAMPATRNEATRCWKAPKVAPFAKLTIGTAIRSSREPLRTAADGCERLRTQTQRPANIALPPHSQSETGTLATHSEKKDMFWRVSTPSERSLTDHHISVLPEHSCGATWIFPGMLWGRRRNLRLTKTYSANDGSLGTMILPLTHSAKRKGFPICPIGDILFDTTTYVVTMFSRYCVVTWLARFGTGS